MFDQQFEITNSYRLIAISQVRNDRGNYDLDGPKVAILQDVEAVRGSRYIVANIRATPSEGYDVLPIASAMYTTLDEAWAAFTIRAGISINAVKEVEDKWGQLGR